MQKGTGENFSLPAYEGNWKNVWLNDHKLKMAAGKVKLWSTEQCFRVFLKKISVNLAQYFLLALNCSNCRIQMLYLKIRAFWKYIWFFLSFCVRLLKFSLWMATAMIWLLIKHKRNCFFTNCDQQVLTRKLCKLYKWLPVCFKLQKNIFTSMSLRHLALYIPQQLLLEMWV